LTHVMVGLQSGADVRAGLAWIEESWVLAFVMERHDNGLYTVFVPSAPTPAAGAIYYLPEDRVKVLDVPVSSAVACVTRLGLGSRDLLARAFPGPSSQAEAENMPDDQKVMPRPTKKQLTLSPKT